jgi:hypothetical protein
MGRVLNVVQGAFWTSVPLFAVYLAVTPRDGRIGWPGEVLWWIILFSSAFLMVRVSPLMVSREEGEEFQETGGVRPLRRTSEWLAYPVVLCLAVFLFASQGLYY